MWITRLLNTFSVQFPPIHRGATLDYFLARILIFQSSELNCQALYTFNQVRASGFYLVLFLLHIQLVGWRCCSWTSEHQSLHSHVRAVLLNCFNCSSWVTEWLSGLKIYISLVYWYLSFSVIGPWFCKVSLLYPCRELALSGLLLGVQLKAEWVPGVGCQITQTNNRILATIFIYSMCFDLTVLLLNTYKLFGINGPGRSRLTHMVFADGLIYFIIAYGNPGFWLLAFYRADFRHRRFLANLIATVFMVLNLNQIMSVVFNVPAAVSGTVRGFFLALFGDVS